MRTKTKSRAKGGSRKKTKNYYYGIAKKTRPINKPKK